MDTKEPSLWKAVDAGDVAWIRSCLEAGADPRAGNCAALRYSASAGNMDCVRFLLPLSDAKAEDSGALRWAAEGGHVDCVRFLLPFSDPKACCSEALQRAVARGHAEIVRMLVPVSDVAIVRLNLPVFSFYRPECGTDMLDAVCESMALSAKMHGQEPEFARKGL